MTEKVRTCLVGMQTLIVHEISAPSCCPVTRNPAAGSRLRVSYLPKAGIVLPVETLRDMVAEYVGGHQNRGIRGMEEMVQDIAIRTAAIVCSRVVVRADLVIVPHGGGAPQMMIVKTIGKAR